MEDVGKAVIMAGQVLMFAFAATIAISLYSTLMVRVDEYKLAENYTNRGDSIVGVEETSYERKATKAEVVMAVLGLKGKVESTGDTDYKVTVGGFTFIYSGDTFQNEAGTLDFPMTVNGRNDLLSKINKDEYTISYSDEKKLVYN